MTFVDSINGFKHLLTEEDLDKTLSMCTSLKGNLRSRFLVLSDDRIPPPKPVNPGRGKRKMEYSHEGQATERKKGPAHFSQPPPSHGVAGVSLHASRVARSTPTAEGSGTNSGRRSTPSRVTKKTAADVTSAVPMEIAGETTSNEDWASAKSNDDDTLEENV